MQITVYDNGGKTFDRYTVIINDHVFGMSPKPNSPQGFNQFCGNLGDLPNIANGQKVVPLEKAPHDLLVAIINRLTIE